MAAPNSKVELEDILAGFRSRPPHWSSFQKRIRLEWATTGTFCKHQVPSRQ